MNSHHDPRFKKAQRHDFTKPRGVERKRSWFYSHYQKLNKTNVRTLGSTDLGRETNKNVQDTYIKKTSKSSFQTIMI